MAVQRFLPDVDRTRRVAGIVIGMVGLSLLTWVVARIVTSGVTPNVTGLVFLLVGGAIAAVGWRLTFLPLVVIEVDLESRRYCVTRRGAQKQGGPLDALGPLSVSRIGRLVGTSNSRRTVTEYLVSPAQHSTIALYSAKTAGQARRKMESLARAWGLSCQSLGGDVRPAGALDVPLHERLHGDTAARKPLDLPAGCGVRINDLSPGYAVVSTFRDLGSLWTGLIFLGIGLCPAATIGPLELWAGVTSVDPGQQILSSLLVAFALIMIVVAARSVRDAFFPGTVTITPEGVRYRGRRMTFAEIEELTPSPIEIIGDRKTIVLVGSFCAPAAESDVVHELQRLIIEVGSQAT